MAERLFTWVAPIPSEALEGVRSALAVIGASPAGNDLLPLGKLPMLHFANITLFEDPGETATLVFESNVDTPRETYIRDLVAVGRRGLDALFRSWAEYPDAGRPDTEVADFLDNRRKRPQLYHLGHPDRSVQEIRGDWELRRSIERELPKIRSRSPEAILAHVRKLTKCPTGIAPRLRAWHKSWNDPPALEPTPLGEIGWQEDERAWQQKLRALGLLAIGVIFKVALIVAFAYIFGLPRWLTMAFGSLIIGTAVYMSAQDSRLLRAVGVVVIVIAVTELACRLLRLDDLHAPSTSCFVTALGVLAPYLVFLLSYAWIALHLKVTRALPPLDPAARTRLHGLLEAEDRGSCHSIYNHVAGLSYLKDDVRPIRWIRTWVALRFLNLFYRTFFVRGKLASIPSIHFAQWSLVDNRRLLFLTNYEDGADSYLDDFFNTLAGGVAFIWFDTVLFPRTTDPRLLKLWVRQGQTLAAVRYRAPVYEALTVALINNNSEIRKGLLRVNGRDGARRWLRRFATAPVEPSLLVRVTTRLQELVGAGSNVP